MQFHHVDAYDDANGMQHIENQEEDSYDMDNE